MGGKLKTCPVCKRKHIQESDICFWCKTAVSKLKAKDIYIHKLEEQIIKLTTPVKGKE